MISLFVSHSSRDRAAASRIADKLQAAGCGALFLDFDPERGIPAGRSWERELYAQLRRTDAVIFLASAASVASRWCFAELSHARSLGRPVFPLRLDHGVQQELLADVQWIDLADDLDAGLSRLVKGLQAAGLDPAEGFAWDPQRSPYPGLAPFGPQDAAVFFAREQETRRLAELLQPTLRYRRGRLVAVVGPSGSGKSSLVHAGLLPRLHRMRAQWTVLPTLLPGTRPTDNLAGCLARAFVRHGQSRPPGELAAALRARPTALAELVGELIALAAADPGPPRALLVVDQAEELLTRSGPREQRAFLELLTASLHVDSSLWTVATVRSEFLSSAPDRAGLAEAIDDSLVVEPLNLGRLAEVIARPAQRAGIEFEPGLVERMVTDATGGDALPLLAYTLNELGQRIGPDRRITAADYDQVGGVVGALQRRADRLTEELARDGLGELVVPTLLEFATVTGNDEPTRRRVPRHTLDPPQQRVVDAFVEARLLTSDRAESGDAAPGSGTIEVTHEALLRQWRPLRERIEADRAGLRLRSELERLAADWQQGGRDESYLLRGGRLATINQWVARHDEELDPLEDQFLQASRALAARELVAARRSGRLWRALAVGLGVVLVIALVASGVAWQQGVQAQEQARLAWSRQLATQADRLVNVLPHTALLAGLQSLSLAHGQARVPPTGLVTALARVTRPSWLLTGHNGPVNSAAFSPDGELLATASDDQTVRLWDVRARRPHGPPLHGHTGVVRAAVFSPDGRLLATASDDRTARLWDVATGQPVGPPLRDHDDWVWAAAFSPDGRLLATGGADRAVRFWEVATGRPIGQPLTGHTDRLSGLAFSPDGTHLASASTDQTVRLWDLAAAQVTGVRTLSGHTGPAVEVAFSPDGRLLASTSTDRTVRLWDVASGLPRGEPLIGHTNQTIAVAFSPDSRLLASTSGDQTVRIWDAGTGLPHGPPLVGHTDWVSGVDFSPDGTQLATAGADQTVRLWSVAELEGSLGRSLLGHAGPVGDVAFGPDGRLLASAGADRSVRLWDVPTGRPHGPPLTGHTSAVSALEFSPDGQLLAAAGGDGTVRLWDVATGQPRGAPFIGHAGAVRAVGFSPDGRLLASGGEDALVRLWEVGTGQPKGAPLTGHDSPVTGVAFSPDGTLLASSSVDRTIRLWDPGTGQSRGEPLLGHTNMVNAVAFSPDGRLLVSAGEDRTVRLWDIATSRPQGEPLTGHTAAVYGVAFRPDGALVASASGDQSVRLWDVATGQVRGPMLTGNIYWVNAVAFSPDGSRLVTAGSDWTVRLWNPAFADWVSVGCRLVNRNLSLTEWNLVASGLPYQRTCPELPAGDGAPPDSPAAAY